MKQGVQTKCEIQTTLGKKSETELGLILPHEHIFVDLRTWDQPGYAMGTPKDGGLLAFAV